MTLAGLLQFAGTPGTHLETSEPPEQGAVRVIVQGSSFGAAARAVRGVGGVITHELSVIDAVAVELTPRQQAKLRRQGLRLYDDSPVEAATLTAGTQVVLDHFTAVSYSNNDGTQRWATDWIEQGDDGQPWQSDGISIVPDGGNNRLRIAAGGVAIWRQATLPPTATYATLTFKYRRLRLETGDVVSVQASRDGGASWTTIGQIRGPANDAGYYTATYDISAYRSSRTAVRFRSSFADTEGSWLEDVVLLDDVQLELDGFEPGTKSRRLTVPTGCTGWVSTARGSLSRSSTAGTGAIPSSTTARPDGCASWCSTTPSETS